MTQRSPEEYFRQQTFGVESDGGAFTPAERAFMQKYLGVNESDVLQKIGITPPAPATPPEPSLPMEDVVTPTPNTGENAMEPELDDIAPLLPPVVEEEIPAEPVAAETATVAGAEVEPEPVSDELEANLVTPENAEAENAEAEAADAEPAEAEIAETGPMETDAAETADATADTAIAAADDTQAAHAIEATDATDTDIPDATVPEEKAETPPLDIPAEESAETAAPAAAPEQAAPTPPETASEPETEAPAEVDGPDANDVVLFTHTVRQQMQIINTALTELSADGSRREQVDALYRSLVTIQNSSRYMNFEDIRVYAERTAGIVDQARSTDMDFGLMVDLLKQETGIIGDMLETQITRLGGPAPGGPLQYTTPATPPPNAATPIPAETAALAKSTAPQVEASSGETPADSLAEPAAAETAAEAPAPAVSAPEAAAPESAAPESAAPEAAAPEAAAPEQPEAAAPEAPAPVQAEASPPQAAPAPQPETPAATAGLKPSEIFEPEEPTFEDIMRQSDELQLVAFYLGAQEFVLPIFAVQEVIKAMPFAKLPSAPPLVAGVINLRGRVTPLLQLRELLDVPRSSEHDDSFIIICRRRGIQMGLIIDRVHTMYRVTQSDVDWQVESHLGNIEVVSGLLKANDHLLGIISVDKIFDMLLEI